MNNEEMGREIGWDDQIENEGQDFEPLPDGEYEFTVASMERGRFPGSAKMTACNMASLDLIVKDADGNDRHVYDTLYLNSKAEWKLSQFFLGIGQKKKGESLKPNWNTVPGSTGKLELYIDEYKDKEGKPRRNNKISKYLPYEPKKFEAGKF
uniref:DUF669 domain-containing protein n=1 Tax=Clostridium sp. NkU-1 TaxID=1095009 RepID=UPI0006CF4189